MSYRNFAEPILTEMAEVLEQNPDKAMVVTAPFKFPIGIRIPQQYVDLGDGALFVAVLGTSDTAHLVLVDPTVSQDKLDKLKVELGNYYAKAREQTLMIGIYAPLLFSKDVTVFKPEQPEWVISIYVSPEMLKDN